MQEKFDLPPGSDGWILKSIGKKWKDWKSNLKDEFYDPTTSIEVQKNKVPQRIREDDWIELLKFWASPEGQVWKYYTN